MDAHDALPRVCPQLDDYPGCRGEPGHPDSPTAAHDFDLLILDSDGIRSDRIDQIAKWLDDRGGVPMLVIVDDEALGTLRLPNHAHADLYAPRDAQRAQGSCAAPDGRGGDRHRRRCAQHR